jgi:hypothetical protein
MGFRGFGVARLARVRAEQGFVRRARCVLFDLRQRLGGGRVRHPKIDLPIVLGCRVDAITERRINVCV